MQNSIDELLSVNIDDIQKKGKKKGKKRAAILMSSLVVVVALTVVTTITINKSNDYSEAMCLLENADYDSAYEKFVKLGDYNNSAEMAKESIYQKAQAQLDDNQWEGAAATLTLLKDYKDSIELIEDIPYRIATVQLENKLFDNALESFTALGEYKDSKEIVADIPYQQACSLLNEGSLGDASVIFERLGDYKDSVEKLKIIKAQIEKNANKKLQTEKNIETKNNNQTTTEKGSSATVDYNSNGLLLNTSSDDLTRSMSTFKTNDVVYCHFISCKYWEDYGNSNIRYELRGPNNEWITGCTYGFWSGNNNYICVALGGDPNVEDEKFTTGTYTFKIYTTLTQQLIATKTFYAEIDNKELQ